MSKNRSSFLKRGREAKKREKQAMKQQRREDRKRGDQQPGEADDFGAASAPPEGMLDGSAIEPLIQPNDNPPQA